MGANNKSKIFFKSITLLLLFLAQSNQLRASEYFAEIPLSKAIKLNPRGLLNQLRESDFTDGAGPYLVEFEVPKKYMRDLLQPKLVLRALFCKASNPKALVLGVHGMQSNHRWYKNTCEFLASKGISAFFYDRRGSGLSEGIKERKVSPKVLIGKEMDPNPSEIKLAPGLRGHLLTGLFLKRLSSNRESPAAHFFYDIEAAFESLKTLYREYDLPIHVFANCFGSRIAIPFVEEHQDEISSLIITAPATDMQEKTNIDGLLKKISIAMPTLPVIGEHNYTKVPLSDSNFVPSGTLAHKQIANNSVSLSLRYVSSDFLWATNALTKIMHEELPRVKVPLLIALADKDEIVINQDIKNRFATFYRGPLKMLTFDSHHMIEFTPARNSFLNIVESWIADPKNSTAPATRFSPAPYLTEELSRASF